MRFGKTEMSDREVRVRLGVPSLDSLVRQRRLLYLSRVARSPNQTLFALIRARGPKGEFTTWLRPFFRDIEVLRRAREKELESMPDPMSNFEAWWELAGKFPNEWKELVEAVLSPDDDTCRGDVGGCVDKPSSSSSPSPPGGVCAFACEQCGFSFEDRRRLAVHSWSKHKQTSRIREYVGNESKCRICKVEFHTRDRLLKHLSERRVRSKHRKYTCAELWMDQDPPKVDDAVLCGLESSVKECRKRARREGHRHTIVERPAEASEPSILKKRRRA